MVLYDPMGSTYDALRGQLDPARTHFCSDLLDAAQEADALIFMHAGLARGLDLAELRSRTATLVLFDTLRTLDPVKITRAGFAYLAIGRPTKLPEAAAPCDISSTSRTVAATLAVH